MLIFAFILTCHIKIILNIVTSDIKTYDNILNKSLMLYKFGVNIWSSKLKQGRL